MLRTWATSCLADYTAAKMPSYFQLIQRVLRWSWGIGLARGLPRVSAQPGRHLMAAGSAVPTLALAAPASAQAAPEIRWRMTSSGERLRRRHHGAARDARADPGGAPARCRASGAGRASRSGPGIPMPCRRPPGAAHTPSGRRSRRGACASARRRWLKGPKAPPAPGPSTLAGASWTFTRRFRLCAACRLRNMSRLSSRPLWKRSNQRRVGPRSSGGRLATKSWSAW